MSLTKMSLPPWARRLGRPAATAAGALIGLTVALCIAAAVAVVQARHQLPDVAALVDYRPKLPMRIYDADGTLLAEFGEERRRYLPIAEIPPLVRNAVLAAEDARFFEHGGLDYKGLGRAALANFADLGSQGGSTITMQVAKNFFLSNEKTFTRKFYEALLTLEIEKRLTKLQILELYMNQIYLGQRAHGFEAASEAYFGKPLGRLDVAEAAMLAGLPKAPSLYNPIVNPHRATARQHYVIGRMLADGFIDQSQHDAALRETLRYQSSTPVAVHGEYAADLARQAMVDRFGPAAYTRGLEVRLTLRAADQTAARRALRWGVIGFERRQAYRGPEASVMLPADRDLWDETVADALNDHPDDEELVAAVVLEASASEVTAMLRDGSTVTVRGAGLKPAASAFSRGAVPDVQIRTGSVVRLVQSGSGSPGGDWTITQLPELQGAFVSLDPETGALRSLVGGFDHGQSQFNHATQAWRQPGSTIKPLVYSAALEHGVTPTTVIDDAPLSFPPGAIGPEAWEPRNADGSLDGPIPLHTALARSKNLVSIRVLQAVGVPAALDWIGRFGLDAGRQPPQLSLVLGTGAATPLEMATAYAVFANGGHRVNPVLIARVSDADGRPLYEARTPVLDDANRAIDPRNAFVMTKLLQQVTAPGGTAGGAQGKLQRPDIAGKTGTTDAAVDAWFAGFQKHLVGVAWLGYDTPRSLGARESGGGVALDVWLAAVREPLRGLPVEQPAAPPGVTQSDGQWVYAPAAGDSAGDSAALAGAAAASSGAAGSAVAGAASGASATAAAAGASAAVAPDREAQRDSIAELFKH